MFWRKPPAPPVDDLDARVRYVLGHGNDGIAVRGPPEPIRRSFWEVRPKLVFAFDATASREHAWAISVPLTDALLKALPGQLDVALAVHGGNKMHTFTRFETDIEKLRRIAAKVRCKMGHTRMLDIFARVLKIDGVGVVVYVGDSFEESDQKAIKIAKALGKQKTRLIILHDTDSHLASGYWIFSEMARLTSGAVIPFDASAVDELRELLSAIAVLAVGGIDKLKEDTTPGGRMLLERLTDH